LVPLGLGGLSSVLASSLGRYRITFTVLAMALLLFSHFLHLKQKNRSKVNTVILWISTAAVIFILIYF
jgi:heme/copper-type cytochrome/quinol oxidase subunit 4